VARQSDPAGHSSGSEYAEWEIWLSVYQNEGGEPPCCSNSCELGQVASVAKQRGPAAHSNGFENVDWEMELPAYQNEGVRQLAATTALAWCGEEHLTTLAAHLPGNGGTARMSSALQVQTAVKNVSTDSKKIRQQPLTAHIFVTIDFQICLSGLFDLN
jgi:hypothetical protein